MSIGQPSGSGALFGSFALLCMGLSMTAIAGCESANDGPGTAVEGAASDAQDPDAVPDAGATPGAGVTLETTRWKATELQGSAVPAAANSAREAHLVLDGAGRFSGSDGCNRVAGSYQVSGDAITFGEAASTRMACADSGETERQFHAALKDATRYRIAGEGLELFGIADTPVALFTAVAGEPASGAEPAPAPTGGASELADTSWQLVRFEGSDDTTLTPDDPTAYTLEFAADGSLTARIDCNRGRGTWESAGHGQLTLGPLALTRAMCPPGSLHDQIVKQLPYIRSYVLKGGRLFLALMADGGIYEFELTTEAALPES